MSAVAGPVLSARRRRGGLRLRGRQPRSRRAADPARHLVRGGPRRGRVRDRRIGLRQDHAAAAARRPARSRPPARCVSAGREQVSGPVARRGCRVPGLQPRAAALAHGHRQRQPGPGGDRRAGGGAGGRALPRCSPRSGSPIMPQKYPAATLRRHAAAAADRALPGAGPFRAADGRAVRRARRHDAAGPAGRGAAHRRRAARRRCCS